MFQHRTMMVAFEMSERVGGSHHQPARPAAPAQRQDLAAANQHLTEAFNQEAAANGGHMTREAFVNDRLANTNLAGAELAQRQQQLAAEFDRYDADQSHELSAAEFTRLVGDHFQAGQGVDAAAHGPENAGLTAADRHALTTGVTERGDAVRANQQQINQWLTSTPEGQRWAASEEGRQILGANGQLATDGLEGNRTRTAMAAMRQFQAPAQQPAGGAAAADPAQEAALAQRIHNATPDQLPGLASDPQIEGGSARLQGALASRLLAAPQSDARDRALGQVMGNMTLAHPEAVPASAINQMPVASLREMSNVVVSHFGEDRNARAAVLMHMPGETHEAIVNRMMSEGGDTDRNMQAVAPFAAARLLQDPSRREALQAHTHWGTTDNFDLAVTNAMSTHQLTLMRSGAQGAQTLQAMHDNMNSWHVSSEEAVAIARIENSADT